MKQIECYQFKHLSISMYVVGIDIEASSLFLKFLFPFVVEHPCWQYFSSGSGRVGYE